jgi:hypothetical protein
MARISEVFEALEDATGGNDKKGPGIMPGFKGLGRLLV